MRRILPWSPFDGPLYSLFFCSFFFDELVQQEACLLHVMMREGTSLSAQLICFRRMRCVVGATATTHTADRYRFQPFSGPNGDVGRQRVAFSWGGLNSRRKAGPSVRASACGGTLLRLRVREELRAEWRIGCWILEPLDPASWMGMAEYPIRNRD